MQQLRDWNNIQGNELTVGQTLFVVQPDQGGLTVKKQDPVVQPNPPVNVPAKSEPVVTETKTDPVLVKKNDPVPAKEEAVPVHNQPIRISEAIKNGSEMLESGLAELIEGTEGNRKYLALHRTAPLGTILKVRNEMNNREVFVRVTGKLPDTALTDKLIIRISKSAYDRLGAIDQRFRVEVTYYK